MSHKHEGIVYEAANRFAINAYGKNPFSEQKVTGNTQDKKVEANYDFFKYIVFFDFFHPETWKPISMWRHSELDDVILGRQKDKKYLDLFNEIVNY